MFHNYTVFIRIYLMLFGFGLTATASEPIKTLSGGDDFARILKLYAQDYARYQATLGGRLQTEKGAGVDVNVEHLIAGINDVIRQAKQSAATLKADFESIPEWMRKLAPGRSEEYMQSVQKILRRLLILQEVVAGLSTGKIERVRSKLTSLLQIYTVSYDELGRAYAANLQKLLDLKGFEGITPKTVYAFIGIGAGEDPKKMSFATLKDHINARAEVIRLKHQLKSADVHDENIPGNGGSDAAAQWWLRQMGYLFADAKAKERYDAWLAGKAAYEAWQRAELQGLGMTADELGAITFQHVMNIGLFKASLDELLANIKRAISEIKVSTGIEPVPLSP